MKFKVQSSKFGTVLTKRGEIITALTITGIILLTAVTFISNIFLSKNKQISVTQASSCAIITKVDDPGSLSSGQDFTCSGTLDPAFANSTNIACGWSKNNAWPQTGGRWVNATCNGIYCSFGIRMDSFSQNTTDTYRLVLYDMSSNCGPTSGKSIPITLYGVITPPPTATPKVNPPCDPGKLDINGNCNSACCANNSQCPSGQSCIVTNGYCQSNFSCGIPPSNTPVPTSAPLPTLTNTPIPIATPTTIPGCNSHLCNGSDPYCVNSCGAGWYCTGSFCQPPPTSTPVPTSTSTPTPTATPTLVPGAPTFTPIPSPTTITTNTPLPTSTPNPSSKMPSILSWTAQIDSNLQVGSVVEYPQGEKWINYFNRLVNPPSNGSYTAYYAPATYYYPAIPKSDLYWCTFMVVDAYNLAGVKGMNLIDQGGVVPMQNYFNSNYNFICYPGDNPNACQFSDKIAILKGIQPGSAIFFNEIRGGGYPKEAHVGVVQSINFVDDFGDGVLTTYEANNTGSAFFSYPIDKGNLKGTPFPVIGFGWVN